MSQNRSSIAAGWSRWLLLPVAICTVAVALFYTTTFLASHGLGRRWLQPFDAFTSFLAAIVLTGFIAPNRKLLATGMTAIILIYVGSEALTRFDPITLEPTMLPIGAAIVGGGLGLAIVAIPVLPGKKDSS